jgi:hypothetical protein
MLDIEKGRREALRWHILTTLHASQPQGATDVFLLSVLLTGYRDVTLDEVRVQLNYLQLRDLLTISERHSNTWVAEIDRYGIDVVEGTVPVESGIARPKSA